MSIWNLTVFFFSQPHNVATQHTAQHFILVPLVCVRVCARVSAIYSFAKIRIYSMKHCRISCDCSLFSILDLCPQWTFNNNKLRCFFSLLAFASTNVKKQQQQRYEKWIKTFYLHYESSWWDWFRWMCEHFFRFCSLHSSDILIY